MSRPIVPTPSSPRRKPRSNPKLGVTVASKTASGPKSTVKAAKASAGNRQAEPLRIVSIGGGNGLSSLLRGLKRYAVASQGELEITAVVTVTDDGGSSGRLRRDFDVLPPGDIRSCMVALSQDEQLLTRLFDYRFDGGRGLRGHSFGNLFLTAMTHLTGDFGHAVQLSSEVLAVAGRIYPSTSSNVRLEARLADDALVSGETRISRSKRRIERLSLNPRRVKPLPETLEAIAKADLITFGPGSLFTSVIPNLLVEGIPKAIAESPARKAYFVNLMSQPGETTNFTAADHITMLRKHAGRYAKQVVDVCVLNSGPLGQQAVAAYGAKQAQPIQCDTAAVEKLGVEVVTTDLVRLAGRRSAKMAAPAKIRHDPGAIGAVAIELAQQARWRRDKS